MSYLIISVLVTYTSTLCHSQPIQNLQPSIEEKFDSAKQEQVFSWPNWKSNKNTKIHCLAAFQTRDLALNFSSKTAPINSKLQYPSLIIIEVI